MIPFTTHCYKNRNKREGFTEMNNQGVGTKIDTVDSDLDEQIVCYYDALLQSIRDGVEDPDLLSEEDLQAAFSEEGMEDGHYPLLVQEGPIANFQARRGR
jgi:hypothetical protein